MPLAPKRTHVPHARRWNLSEVFIGQQARLGTPVEGTRWAAVGRETFAAMKHVEVRERVGGETGGGSLRLVAVAWP